MPCFSRRFRVAKRSSSRAQSGTSSTLPRAAGSTSWLAETGSLPRRSLRRSRDSRSVSWLCSTTRLATRRLSPLSIQRCGAWRGRPSGTWWCAAARSASMRRRRSSTAASSSRCSVVASGQLWQKSWRRKSSLTMRPSWSRAREMTRCSSFARARPWPASRATRARLRSCSTQRATTSERSPCFSGSRGRRASTLWGHAPASTSLGRPLAESWAP
mmetsp:Transcript_23305/g.51467  ORF Transcript_23305/g.51467 Transcript_23305/m.51467 type:complete len:215 (-) Transcript_23305:1558-2202(-)